MVARLRVGVIGLGRRWARNRPALVGPSSPVEIKSVCDAAPARAARAAARLGCAAAAGPGDLVSRPDVDAVLLLDRPWFGLWPLGPACRAGKAVLCFPSLAGDDAHADSLHEAIRASPAPVMMALPPASCPAADRLRALLAERMGPPRLLRVDATVAGAAWMDAALGARPVLGLIHLCAELFGGPPTAAWAAAPWDAGLASFLFEFGPGRAAQLSVIRGAGVRPACRLAVTAEHGCATVELPRRLRWRDRDGEHALRLPRPDAGELFARFAGAVTTGQRARPDFEDAYRALTWWRAALQSRPEGRRVEIPGPAC
jgi:predicted dehydrogenase